MYYHDKVTNSPTKCTRNELYSYVDSEMMHIQKDCKVKTYIPQESANQNVAIFGERNDEDLAVLLVMELIEKITDGEVDEMIPETDVDDTQCSEQRADVSVPQIADRIAEVVSALHGSESQNEPSHRSSTCRDTHTQSGGEDRRRFCHRRKLRTHRMRRVSQGKTHQ